FHDVCGFFFQAEDGIRDFHVTGVQTCALPIYDGVRKGFSDARLANLLNVPEAELRAHRHALGVRPVYKRVDTCAAEFKSSTAYKIGRASCRERGEVREESAAFNNTTRSATRHQ